MVKPSDKHLDIQENQNTIDKGNTRICVCNVIVE